MNTPSAQQQPSRATRASAAPRAAAPVTAPVTAHRLFPAIVALWFAALLGIGSLAIAPDALSAVVSALGIPKLIHAASPPLGFTARVLLALVMAGIGVVVGLVVGSRIAARNTIQPQRRTDPTKGRQDKPTRTYSYDPLEHAVEREPEPAQKRRPLRASEAFADIEPLTDAPEPALQAGYEDAASPSDDHFAVLGAPRAQTYQPDDAIVRDHFDAWIANSGQPDTAGDLTPSAPFTTLVEQDAEPAFDAPVCEEPVVEVAREGRFTRDLVEIHAAQPRHDFEAEAAPVSEPAPPPSPLILPLPAADADVRRTLSEAPLSKLGTVQLVERLALAMAAASEARDASPHGAAPLAQSDVDASQAEAWNAAHDDRSIAQRPTDEPMELDGYFEDAARRELPRFGAPIADPTPEPVAPAEAWSAPDFAEHATPTPPAHDAAFPRFEAARPSILDPIAQAWDDESSEDDDLPTIAPPRFLSAGASALMGASAADDRNNRPLFGGRPNPAARAIDASVEKVLEDGSDVAEDRYPSLLDIQPAQRETIRIAAPEAQQAEPIVMFPNAGPNGGQRADAPFAPPPASTLQSRRSLQFQAPVGAGSGAPVMPPELPANPVDAEEADRALRAALATLQRMSGGR